MKVCPICQSTYENTVDFCFKDGAPLEQQGSPDTESVESFPDTTGLTIEDLEPPDAVSLSGLIPVATDEDDLKTLPLSGQSSPVLEEDELATVTSGVQQVGPAATAQDSDVGDPFEEPEAADFRARVTGTHRSAQLRADPNVEEHFETEDRMETVEWDGERVGTFGANDGSSGFLKMVVGLCALVVLIIGYQMQANSPVEEESVSISDGSESSVPSTEAGPEESASGAEATEETGAAEATESSAVDGDVEGEEAAAELDSEDTQEGNAEENEGEPEPSEDGSVDAEDAASSTEEEDSSLEDAEPELTEDEQRDRARAEAREERLRKRAERLKEEKRERRREARREAAKEKAAAKEKEAAAPSSDPGNPWTSGGGSTASDPVADAGNPWGVSAPAADTPKKSSGLTKVTITTKPSGAKVKLAGKSRGNSPVKAELPVGTHEVQVSKEGFVPRSSYVKVGDSTPVSVSIALEPLEAASAKREGTLFVSSSPAGALLYVDGTSKGRTPLSVTVVEGTHSLKLVAEGKEPLVKRIKVDFGRTSTVRRFIEIP